MSADKKIAVNGSTSGYTPTFQDSVTMVLLQNGGVKRIQTTFKQRLDEAGWTQNLREYVERLFRSGEVTTHAEAVRIIMKKVHGKDMNGISNDTRNVPDLVIPSDAKKDAVDAVKKELTVVLKTNKEK